MRLDAYLNLKDLSQAEFARRIGSTPTTVHRIIAGAQNIPLSLQDAIVRETEGAVTAEDLRQTWREAKSFQSSLTDNGSVS